MRLRPATVTDAAIITGHRKRMYLDAGRRDDKFLDLMAQNFEPWVVRMLELDKYLGWLAMDDAKVVAGSGLLILDWPPHPLDPWQCFRGYLLNVYVEPEYRRRKLASSLIEMALAEARSRNIRVVALHSTDEARAMYESNGFRSTNEMFHIEPDEE